VTEEITRIVLTKDTPWFWYFGFTIAGGLATMLLVAMAWLFLKGVGIWGITIPGAWGFAIINFVWWIGIGHAGTLISAILLLFKQTWRNSINRFAEAMTLFAVVCAGMFPVIHVGRPWLAYWLFPYPEQMNVWPQFRSPLLWDVFAVSTYATISVVFWYIGMVPDLRHHARQGEEPVRRSMVLRDAVAGLARERFATGCGMRRRAAAGRAGDAAGALRPHGHQLRLRGGIDARAGTRRSSRRTSSPAPFTPASPW
jgi:hypothetical protein